MEMVGKDGKKRTRGMFSVAHRLLYYVGLSAAKEGPWVTITYDNFSGGWGNYASVFGSGDAQWVASSLKIQDNSGDHSSIFLQSARNVSAYSDLRVRFWYYADSMVANKDSFYLEYLDDPSGTWQIVEHFIAGQDFVNHQHKYTTVTFSEMGSFTMKEAANIRFRCDATDHADRIYLDEIRFEGLTTLPSDPSAMPSLRPSASNAPSSRPSISPSLTPSTSPSQVPSTSSGPSAHPSIIPSRPPSLSPSASKSPSELPSTSLFPTAAPSQMPSTSIVPSSKPSLAPTMPPSLSPSTSASPSEQHSVSLFPSSEHTSFPPTTSLSPSDGPSSVPSQSPTTFAQASCPKNRMYPPEKFAITPYTDNNLNDIVQDDLNEISYVAYSDQTDSNGHRYAYMASDKEQYSLKVIQFTHNIFDSGHNLHGHGTAVATYTLFTEVTNDDWEDISLGPCTDIDTDSYTTDQVCIYVGGIGNNNSPQRKELFVYKFVEPIIGADGPQDQTVSFATIGFRYADGFDQSKDTYYDAEAMFVDWVGANGDDTESAGDVYIATKGYCEGGVGKIPVSQHRELGPGQVLSNYDMTRVVAYPPVQGQDASCADDSYRVWSGADMARNGELIAMVREGPPSSVYFYPRASDQSVADALRAVPCPYVASISVGLEHEKKYEAVGFVDSEALRFGTISECAGSCSPTLYQFELEYPDSDFPVMEGPLEGWEALSYDSFEENGDWGNWKSGGAYAIMSNEGSDSCNGTCACQGDWAVQLNQDRGSQSSMFHNASYACNEFSLLRVTFQFKFRGYDHLDTLFLEISLDGGSNYFLVGDWAHSVPELPDYDDPLTRAICYDGKVTLYPSHFRVTSFGNSVKLRFRNSGNSDNDRVYVDSILFEGQIGESNIE